MKSFKFVCGNVSVVLEAFDLDEAFAELQRRLEQAGSCGVQLPNWLEFECW
jgi:hypothetical protein